MGLKLLFIMFHYGSGCWDLRNRGSIIWHSPALLQKNHPGKTRKLFIELILYIFPMNIHDQFIRRWQEYRTQKLEKIASFFVRCGIKANAVTFFSFAAGIAAVFFLFQNYFLFLLTALLHLLFDALDGVIARRESSSQAHPSQAKYLPDRKSSSRKTFGTIIDHGGDSLLTVLALAKIGWFLGDYYPYIIAALFALAVLMHFRFGAPVIFMRTAVFILLLLFTLPVAAVLPYQGILLTIGYMAAGVVTLYSLARQWQWMIKEKYVEK